MLLQKMQDIREFEIDIKTRLYILGKKENQVARCS